MATVLSEIDYTKTDAQTVFSDSSRHDTLVARSFWQSVYLLPHFESRLINRDGKEIKKLIRLLHQDAKSRVDDNARAALVAWEQRQREEAALQFALTMEEMDTRHKATREQLHTRKHKRAQLQEKCKQPLVTHADTCIPPLLDEEYEAEAISCSREDVLQELNQFDSQHSAPNLDSD